MALTLALTRNVLPELAGREWFAESSGVKRVRVALVEPARLASAPSSDPERVELAELAVLAEMADDKTVAALQDIVSPGHAGSTCTPAQASAHGGSMPAQANQQMQMHAVPVCAGLAELAPDEETVAAPQGIVSPGHAGTGHARAPVGVPWAASTDQRKSHWEAKRTDSSSASVTTSAYSCRSSSSSDVSGPAPGSTATPAPPPFGAPAVPPAAPPVAPPPLPADLAQMFDEPIGPDTAPPAAAPLVCGSMPAQANQQMQMHAVSVECGSHLPAALACSSIPLQQLSGFGADASELHFLFARLFTPKHPSTLPRSQWLSYTRLFSIVQPYAPARVWMQGRGNLKQLVIEWCQHHPAYAGLAISAWCMRGEDDDQPAQAGRRQPTVYKFCFEYTS